MKKGLLCLIFVIALISFVSAENITIDYPTSVTAGTVFQVDITLINYTMGVYDVKIDILNSSGDRLSEILEGSSWQSTTYYVDEAINTSLVNSSSFSLNITENLDDVANITVKIRDSSSNADTYEFYPITITKYTPPTPPPTDEIYVELEWDEEDIISGEEFKIKVKAYDLEDEYYKIKVWIEDDEGHTLTERFGIENDGDEGWKSGTYWSYEFMEGSGDESENINLKMRLTYDDFVGDATIFVSIEENDSNSNIDEEDYDIEILEPLVVDDDDDDEKPVITAPIASTTSKSSDGTIKLGSSEDDEDADEGDVKNKNSIIYKSKNEYIKEWSTYVFGLICVGIIILLIKERR